ERRDVAADDRTHIEVAEPRHREREGQRQRERDGDEREPGEELPEHEVRRLEREREQHLERAAALLLRPLPHRHGADEEDEQDRQPREERPHVGEVPREEALVREEAEERDQEEDAEEDDRDGGSEDPAQLLQRDRADR